MIVQFFFNNMRYLLVFIVTFLCCFSTAEAQSPNLKWGKPSQIEWDFVAWGEAPDVEAVILNRTMDVTYVISKSFADQSSGNLELSYSRAGMMGSNSNQVASMTYENKLRIKILKDVGARYANIDIIYYEDSKDRKEYDEIISPKVAVFSKNEKGKVSRRSIKAEGFSREAVNDYYKVLHVQIPDVKAGDIIEYQYFVTSSRVAFLYDFSFQEDIPVLYAKCDMDIPAFLQFDMKVPVHPLIKSKVERGTVRSEATMGDYQAPKTFATNHYIIEAHDILPKDYDRQRIEAAAREKGEDVSSLPIRLMKTLATIKNMSPGTVIPMPQDKNHIMIGQ